MAGVAGPCPRTAWSRASSLAVRFNEPLKGRGHGADTCSVTTSQPARWSRRPQSPCRRFVSRSRASHERPRPGRRRAAGNILAAVAGGTLLAACGHATTQVAGEKGAARHPRLSALPVAIVPAPAGLLGGTAVLPNGTIWTLSGTSEAKTLQAVNLRTRRISAIVPAPASAVAIAGQDVGPLALGLATSTTGAVELVSPSTGRPVATVAVGSPVVAVAVSPNGQAVYAVNGNGRATTVAVISTTTDRVTATLPAPLATVALVPNSSGSSLWLLQRNGVVSELSLRTGTTMTLFPVGHSGRALALSPSGSTLYVLKGQGTVRNVAVVNLATEAVTTVLPAPAGAVDLGTGLVSHELYDFATTARAGSVQAFRTPA